MSESQIAIPRSNVRFGEWLSIGFQAFGNQWQSWLVQMLIATGIALSATLCLVLPVFLVLGPLSSGLHYCGLRAVRGQPVDGTAMRRGWETAGQSMIAYIVVSFLHVLPAMVLYLLFTGAFMAMMMSGAIVPPGARPMRPAPAPGIGIHVEDFSKAEKPQETDRPRDGDRSQAQPTTTRETPESHSTAEPAVASKPDGDPNAKTLPPAIDGRTDENEARADERADGEDEPAGNKAAPAVAPPVRAPGMPNNRELAFFGTMFVMYGLMLVGMLLMMIWTIWFGMRTMYVMPLIADRGNSFSEALTESWRLTKANPWQLLLFYFLALVVMNVGVYFCYVGMLASMPVYYALIAAAYEAHALPQFTPDDEAVPYGEPA